MYVLVHVCVYLYLRWPALSIHGDKVQSERDFVLKGLLYCVFSTCVHVPTVSVYVYVTYTS